MIELRERVHRVGTSGRRVKDRSRSEARKRVSFGFNFRRRDESGGRDKSHLRREGDENGIQEKS